MPHSFTLSLNNVSMLKGSYDRRKGPGKNQGAPPDPRHLCCKFSREIACVRGPFAFQPRCSHRTSAVRPVWNLGPQHFSYQFSHKLPLVSYMFMCISPAHAHRKHGSRSGILPCLSPMFHTIVFARCPCACPLRRLVQNGGPAFGTRIFL